MMKKKKLPEIIIIGSILAAVALPASVHAALESINLVTTAGSQTLPITPIAPITAQNSAPTPTRQQGSLQVPSIVSASQQIFRSINTGNINGAIRQILGILGQMGLVDPATDADQVATDASNSGGSSAGNPYANPQTPEQVYDLQRHTDVVRSEDGQKLSQILFGSQGQQAAEVQLQDIEDAQQVALDGQQGVADTYQDSAAQAEQNVTSANNVEAKSTEAQSKKVSQDILKAIASQNADLGKIGAGNSAQLAYLGKAASYQSAQISAVNAGLVALNDKTQTIGVLAASQNYQAAQINAAIDRQSHYQEMKDSAQENAAYQSSSLIYIPGLVPKAANGTN